MAGIELDASAGPLEVVASVSAELGRMNARMERAEMEHRRREWLRARTPQDVRLFASGASNVSGNDFAMSLDGPDTGFYWIVRRWSIGGITWTTSVNGTGLLFVTAMGNARGQAATAGIATLLPTTEIVDDSGGTNTLPYIGKYSSRQIVVQANETLMAVVHAPSDSTDYATAVEIELHRSVTAETDFGG